MNNQIPRTLVSSLLLCASLAFPRQHQAIQRADILTPALAVPEQEAAASRQEVIKCTEKVDAFPARGGSVDWGLALSGGGIRAGAFSVGVLKALYELRLPDKNASLLDNIDVISSVSGGGYASYWLLTRFDYSKEGDKFGEAALGDGQFLKGMCELQKRSAFITKKDAWRMLWRSKGTAFNEYQRSIEETFGNPLLTGKRLDFLRTHSESGRVPYFIFNTTLKAKGSSVLGKVFELTPVHMGNPVVGFCTWAGNNCGTWRLNESPGISESVGISGAAVKIKWARKLTNDKNCLEAGDGLNLSDGGFSDNLGALALIRRGVENIIIVDSVHDRKYKFEEYEKLRRHLRQMGIKLSVAQIDDYLAAQRGDGANNAGTVPDVSEGTARSAPDAKGGIPINSRIFYIKLSKPTPEMLSDAGEGVKLAEKIEDRLGTDKTNCNALDEEVRFLRDLYAYKLKKYVDEKQEKGLMKIFWGDFPQIPTADQRYAPELMEALVALGYLKALKLKRLVGLEGALGL